MIDPIIIAEHWDAYNGMANVHNYLESSSFFFHLPKSSNQVSKSQIKLDKAKRGFTCSESNCACQDTWASVWDSCKWDQSVSFNAWTSTCLDVLSYWTSILLTCTV